MKIIESIGAMRMFAAKLRRQVRFVGFVPTMGALHEGHLSLVRRARRDNDASVVSIFVNPLQFGPAEDFRKYPRTLAKDLALLRKEKVDAVFLPSAKAIFPDGFEARIHVPSLEGILEGAARPGHFQGVATIVAKLFNVVQPARAYFGQKDFQQVRVIARMIEDLSIPVQLIACATVREKDGLACSSRNRYLSAQEREDAVQIYQALFLGRELISERVFRDSRPLIARLTQILSKIPRSDVDYVAVVDPETLEPMSRIRRPALLAAAVKIGKTRLIDNIIVP